MESIGINPFVGCDELMRLELAGDNPRFRMEGPLLTEPETGRVIACLTRTVGALRVPEGIAEIGDWALYGCSELTEIDLPGSLRRIGAGGLNACMACLSLELPEGLTELGDLALADCFLLERVTLPASLRIIGAYAFSGCVNLPSVALPDEPFFYEIMLEVLPVVDKHDIPPFLTDENCNNYITCRSEYFVINWLLSLARARPGPGSGSFGRQSFLSG